MDEHTPDQPADETSVTTKAPRTRTARTAAATTETPTTRARSREVTMDKPAEDTPEDPAPEKHPPAVKAPVDRATEAPTTETPAATPAPAAADVRTTQLPTTAPAPVTTAMPTTQARPARSRPAEVRPAGVRSGEVRSADVGSRRTEPLPVDRAGDYRAAGMAEPTVPTNIYRARRPIVAVFLVIPAVAVGLLLIRALAIAAFGPAGFRTDGVIASSLALASLPLLVAGLYGLITGAAHGSEHYGFKVWARPPLAYLLVGIAFVAAAALAIR